MGPPVHIVKHGYYILVGCSVQITFSFDYWYVTEIPSLRWRKQASKGENYVSISSDNEVSHRAGYLSVIIVPFVLHLGFMATTAFLVMHVQVATRFLSASPPLYWFASYLMVFPVAGQVSHLAMQRVLKRFC
ncbi:unnamed protein product [Ilex paraguariensis]|uniref:GPI mannosyltransferase 2 n=1 Tax=Ilex paraguariensis TaxID=185542 RepID=A0ABC8V3P3_9AQUA